MRLYFIETEEWPGEWLTHTNTGERTLIEARDRREVPFWGEVTLRYLPRDGKIVGLSKIPRGVRCLAARLQTQERLTSEIADAFFRVVNPIWVSVAIDAAHMCVSARGVESPATTRTATRRQHRARRVANTREDPK